MPAFDFRQIQKVEFKTNQCNVGIVNYDGAGKNLLITDVPLEAGSMIGSLSVVQYLTNSTFPNIPLKPRVYVEYTTPVSGGAGVDQAKFNGRIELREFA
jgi:hypothetical protein